MRREFREAIATHDDRAIGVLIVEPDHFRRRGLVQCVEEDLHLRVDAVGADLVRALEGLSWRKGNDQALILNAAAPGVASARFWAMVRLSLPRKIAIMAVTNGSDEDLLEYLFAAGVAGLYPQRVEPSELCEAVRAMVNGQVQIHSKLAEQLRMRLGLPSDGQGMFPDQDHRRSPESVGLVVHGARVDLTPREKEVLVLICEGKTNRQIGLELGIVPRTVAFHVSNILKKSGLSSRLNLALAVHGA